MICNLRKLNLSIRRTVRYDAFEAMLRIYCVDIYACKWWKLCCVLCWQLCCVLSPVEGRGNREGRVWVMSGEGGVVGRRGQVRSGQVTPGIRLEGGIGHLVSSLQRRRGPVNAGKPSLWGRQLWWLNQMRRKVRSGTVMEQAGVDWVDQFKSQNKMCHRGSSQSSLWSTVL